MTTSTNIRKLWAMSETAAESLKSYAFDVTAASQLVEAGLLRDDLDTYSNEARAIHREELSRDLDARALELAQQGATPLLDQVAVSWGLSWATLARMLGVSDTAIRKWRRGEAVAPENLRQLARLVSFLRLVKEQVWVRDVAAWLEMRVAEAATVTYADLYPKHVDLLYELATHRVTPHDALDQFDRAWRDKYSVDRRFRTIEASDGPVLRMKSPRDA